MTESESVCSWKSFSYESTVIWIVMPYSSETARRFGGMYRLKSIFQWNQFLKAIFTEERKETTFRPC
jgi:hypothetical protein